MNIREYIRENPLTIKDNLTTILTIVGVIVSVLIANADGFALSTGTIATLTVISGVLSQIAGNDRKDYWKEKVEAEENIGEPSVEGDIPLSPEYLINKEDTDFDEDLVDEKLTISDEGA